MCSGGAVEAAPAGEECAQGGYCPSGATSITLCAAGYYANRTGGSTIADTCVACPAGYYCPSGTIDPIAAGLTCPDGHYCPEGTTSATSFPCNAGRYMPAAQTTRTSLASCLICPEGSFCEQGFGGEYDNTCLKGYYCPAGTEAADQHPCPIGRYSNALGNTDSANCTTCDQGSYCPAGSQLPVDCPAGTFNPSTGGGYLQNCQPCTAGSACPTEGESTPSSTCKAGHYCPEGTKFQDDHPCPPGTFTESTSLTSQSGCTICPTGKACGWATGGANLQQDCAQGHYCPEGTTYPEQFACPPGTFSTATNNAADTDCTDCTAGMYCAGGGAAESGECAAGHYCPLGTNSSTRFPCPAGRYSHLTNNTVDTDCTECPVGHYCPEGSTSVVACPAGTYTNTLLTESAGIGSESATELASGTASSVFPACQTCPAGSECAAGTSVVSGCLAGFYSPRGATTCTPCRAGFTCPTGSLSEDDMEASYGCPAGAWCPEGTDDAAPTSISHPCPDGQYCEAETSLPVNCPAGTYNPSFGIGSADECLPCPAGSYCLEGSNAITGPCGMGYYCLINSTGSTQEACPQGTYRNESGAAQQSDCATCEVGHYCPIATQDPVVCPQGFYCTSGLAAPIPCPSGTYGASTMLTMSSDCTDCDAGSYCSSEGLLAPTGLCDPGYYCVTGASTSAPESLPQGGVCPEGGYCTAGSSGPQACPPGTYNNVTGSRSTAECEPCPPGYYCKDTSSPGPTGPCDAGYYCTGSATNAQQFVTSQGYYTPSASSAEVACEAGTYNPYTNASTCLACPAGFYCEDQATVNYTMCPPGSYCREGSYTPTPCPKGTFDNTGGLTNSSDCTPCTPGMYCLTNGLLEPTGNCSAGFYCTLGSDVREPTLVSYGGRCPVGHYCPEGTDNPLPCPLGTFMNAQSAEAESDCKACTAGYYCNDTALANPVGRCFEGYYCIGSAESPTPTPDDATGGICPVGSFCPEGSQSFTSCADGSYANTTGTATCTECPEGYYCTFGSETPIICPAGHYCPAGTGATIPECPIGTFSAAEGESSISMCTACTAGSYCETPALEAVTGPCTAGYYCPEGSYTDQGGNDTVSEHICFEGHYCVAGSPYPDACPPGTFTAAEGNIALGNCTSCTAGYYCETSGLSAVTDECAGGYYCSGGASIATPNATAGDAGGDICDAGEFCPAGSPSPQSCDAGSYNPLELQTECVNCPAGYFCVGGSTDYSSSACPLGHYCPNGTRYNNEFPCPVGTIGTSTGLQSVEGCTECPAGSYCDTAGSDTVTSTCDGGFVCSGGSSSQAPTVVNGYICPEGHFCEPGATFETVCTAGMYCGSVGLSEPTANCSSGYYCLGGATVATPTDGVTGDVCPAGHYCVEGATFPAECPVGTFSSSTGAADDSVCMDCTAGSYCNESGIAEVSGPCPEGFFCANGTSTPSEICPDGHMCPMGSSEPVPCPPGSYQVDTQQASCDICPGRYYCPGFGNTILTDCPEGYFCPSNSTVYAANPCPASTYSNVTNLLEESECQDCPPGFYCFSAGDVEPTGACAAGYYCTGGASSPTPTDGTTGNVCPAGGYCPENSIEPLPCPAGTIAPSEGAINETACLDCPIGQFCASSGATALNSSVPCDAGYLCILGSSSPTPSDNITGRPCVAGTYCPQGATSEISCNPGTYNPSQGQSECLNCTQGQQCPDSGMTFTLDCPVGSYCPEGTIHPIGCPAGTFSNSENVIGVELCLDCPVGQYCDSSNLTVPSGDCAAGYFCAGGDAVPNPTGTYPASGPCPAGHYCLEGTTAPTECDSGTFNPSTQADEESDCLPCTAGFYCASLGLSTVTGPCTEGFYCDAGASVSNGTLCPVGYYCPSGSADPVGCDDGTYQDAEGAAACKACPAGFFCNNNATAPVECTLGYYCPENTDFPIACPHGTYGGEPQLANVTMCSSCPAGKYCVNGFVSGDCTAGYICWGNSSTAFPDSDSVTSDEIGSRCPAGYYCLEGAVAPSPCPNDTVRSSSGAAMLTECEPCPSGFLCGEATSVPVGCPAGFYCPEQDAIACPVRTYSSNTSQSDISTCIPCPAGFWCQDEGLSDYSPFPCPSGFYCPEGGDPLECPNGTYRDTTGAASVSECHECPAGSFCRDNVIEPCQEGTFCPSGAAFPSTCAGGYYCPAETSEEIPCPAGFSCSIGSTVPVVCELGTFCNGTSVTPSFCQLGYSSILESNRTSEENSCSICPAGKYQSDPSLTVCSPCDAGYLCEGGATTPTPNSTSTEGGVACPAGHYCPAGTKVAVPCPQGTYNPSKLGKSSAACLLCPSGMFNNLVGQSRCMGCSSSSTSTPGSTTCNCIGRNRAFQSSDSFCICEPRFEFFDNGLSLSEEDSTQDCQPIVYDRCIGDDSRAMDGSCVDRSGSSCSKFCGGSKGSFIVTLGVCECTGMADLETVCDGVCRDQTPSYRYIAEPGSHPGFLIEDDPVSLTRTVVDLSQVDGFVGDIVCDEEECDILTALVDSGIGGTYGPTQALFEALTGYAATTAAYDGSSRTRSGDFETEDVEEPKSFDIAAFLKKGRSPTHSGISARRRLLQSTGVTDAVISPAVMCLQLGETLMFDLVGEGSYPIYEKDNLLNTNANFDYGPFRELENTVLSNGTSVSLFAFTFTQPGIYVFSDSQNSDQQTIIAVQRAETVCPLDGRVTPVTATNLVALGVTRTDDLVLSPDWVLIAIMGGLVMFVFIAVIFALYYFQSKTWGSGEAKQPAYRRVAANNELDLWKAQSKGSILKAENVSGGMIDAKELDIETGAAWTAKVSPGEEDHMNEMKSDFDFEGFDFHSLYKKLEETKGAVETYFTSQEKDLRSFYKHISMETDHLKSVLAVKMQVQLQTSGEGFTEALARLVTGEISSRKAFENIIKRKEASFQRLLQDIRKKIQNLKTVDVFQFRQLIKEAEEHVDTLTSTVREERRRRHAFAAHVEITGEDIIRALAECDFVESKAVDRYMMTLHMFSDKVGSRPGGVLDRIRHEESQHSARLEALEESGGLDKNSRKLEQLNHDANLIRLVQDIEREVENTLISLESQYARLARAEDEVHTTWKRVRYDLLEERIESMRAPEGGRLFRGINPDLAKVLAGLLGQKGGVRLNPVTGEYQPMTSSYDPAEIFEEVNAEDDKSRNKQLIRPKSYIVDELFGEDGSMLPVTEERQSVDDNRSSFPVIEREVLVTGLDLGDQMQASLVTKPQLDRMATSNVNELTKKLDEVKEVAEGEAVLEFAQKREDIEKRQDLSASEKMAAQAEIDAKSKQVVEALKAEADAHVAATTALLEKDEERMREEQHQVQQMMAQLTAQMQQISKLEAEAELELKKESELDLHLEEDIELEQKRVLSILDDLASEGEEGEGEGRTTPSTLPESDILSAGDVRALFNLHKSKQITDIVLRNMREKVKKRQQQRNNAPKSSEVLKEKKMEVQELQRNINRAKILSAINDKLENDEPSHEHASGSSAQGHSRMGSVLAGAAAGEFSALGFDSNGKASPRGVNGGGERTEHPDLLRVASHIEKVEKESKEEEDVELRLLSDEKKREEDKLQQEISSKLSAEKQRLRREKEKKKKEIQAKLKAAQDSDDYEAADALQGELESILRNHDEELDKLDSSMDLERARQMKALQEQMKAKEIRKKNALRSRKQKAMEKEKKEKAVLEENKLREQESVLVEESLSMFESEEEKRAAAKDVLERVFRKRHQRELTSMIQDQYLERANFIKKELAADDADPVAVEKKASEELEPVHEKRQMELRAQQTQRIKDEFLKLYPDETFEGSEWDNLRSDEEVNVFRNARANRLAEEQNRVQEQIQKLRAEEEASKADQWARLEQEMADLETRQQEEIERIAKAADDRNRRLNEQLIAEKAAIKKREMEGMANLDEEQRRMIIDLHTKELRQLEEALDAERERQKANLIAQAKERAAMKRQMQLKKKQRRLRAKARKQREEKRKQRAEKKEKHGEDLSSDDDDDDDMLLPMGSLMDTHVQHVVLKWKEKSGEKAADGTFKEETRAVELDAGVVPVFKRLLKIERMVGKLNSNTNELRDKLYHDESDQRFTEYGEDSLNPDPREAAVCDVDTLTSSQFVLYRFGVSLINTLHRHGLGVAHSPGLMPGDEGSPMARPVRLLLAEYLPTDSRLKKKYEKTAFRNSIHYDAENHILYVRHQRLESPGSFVLLLVHSLSHIGSGKWDDRHVDFVKHFYDCLQLLCSDFFYTEEVPKVVLSGSAASNEAAKKDGTEEEEEKKREKADLNELMALRGKFDAVSDLVDARSAVSVDTQDVFAENKLMGRLQYYSAFSNNADLRQYLQELEADVGEKDYQREFQASSAQGWDYVMGSGPVLQDQSPIDGEIAELESLADKIEAEIIRVAEDFVKTSQIVSKGRFDTGDGSVEGGEEAVLRSRLTQLELTREKLSKKLEIVTEEVRKRRELL